MALSEKTLAAAKLVVNDDKLFKMMDYLRGRWSDEKEFEDINDYGKKLQELLPAGVEYVRMSKRPFGPIIKLPEAPANGLLFLKITGNSACLSIKWVK